MLDQLVWENCVATLLDKSYEFHGNAVHFIVTIIDKFVQFHSNNVLLAGAEQADHLLVVHEFSHH